jgi:two-component system phosphate regulon sensor histidine kinase PhoR
MLRTIINMRSSTLRIILLASSLLVAILIAIQLFWLSKIYSLEQKNFDNNVSRAIHGFYEDLGLNEQPGFSVAKAIWHPNANTFVIDLKGLPFADSMENLLASELENFNVYADYDVAFFNSKQQSYTFKSYRPGPSGKQQRDPSMQIPEFKKDYNYISLYFPHRSRYILKEIFWWIAGSVILVFILILFGLIIYFFYQQKFLNEVQKDFVNNFTHEFKTPLAVMKIASDVLTQPGIQSQPERLIRYNKVISEQVQSLQNKTERLLQTMRADNDRLTIERAPVNLHDLVSQALEDIEPLINERKAIVEFKENKKNAIIIGDRDHLVMVMVNLIENALKYSQHPHIIIEINGHNGHYSISVKDNGIGIDKKYRHKIFKKFFRVPTGNIHNVKGFGLGLNYVKRVVDEHDGSIEVNSIPDIGSEFIITLPKV